MQASQLNSSFYEKMTIRGSREDMDTLIEQIVNAPDNYSFGQLTSWLVTAHQFGQFHRECNQDGISSENKHGNGEQFRSRLT